MAGIASQPSGTKLYMTHYAVSSPWWTMLAIANLDPSSQASVHLEALSDTGHPAAYTDKVIPAKGSLWVHVKAIFGIGG